MTFPTSATGLVPLIQASDGAQPTESYTIANPYTYRLGANAATPLPAGRQRIPKGAIALPANAAPTLTSQLTSSGHFLTTGGHVYKWAVSTVTRNGETIPSAILTSPTLASGTTGAVLGLPAASTTALNPALSRKLYRTKADGSQLYWVADIDGVLSSSYVDGTPDDALILVAPTSNSSGLTSSVTSVVGVLAAGGTGAWTEVASSPITEQYSIDYSQASGGVLTFAAADVGKTVTITFAAADNINKTLLNSLITAITEMAATGTVIVAQGVTHNLAAGERWLACNGGVMGGTTTINLASITPYAGQEVMISNRSGVGTTLIVPNTSTDTINGATSYSLTTPYSSVTLKYSSSLWIIVQRGV